MNGAFCFVKNRKKKDQEKKIKKIKERKTKPFKCELWTNFI